MCVSYQINARTELAVRYNDISPLENHHCAVAFQILSLPECNIFANVDLEAFKQIRQVGLQHLCFPAEETLRGWNVDIIGPGFAVFPMRKKVYVFLVEMRS